MNTVFGIVSFLITFTTFCSFDCAPQNARESFAEESMQLDNVYDTNSKFSKNRKRNMLMNSREIEKKSRKKRGIIGKLLGLGHSGAAHGGSNSEFVLNTRSNSGIRYNQAMSSDSNHGMRNGMNPTVIYVPTMNRMEMSDDRMRVPKETDSKVYVVMGLPVSQSRYVNSDFTSSRNTGNVQRIYPKEYDHSHHSGLETLVKSIASALNKNSGSETSVRGNTGWDTSIHSTNNGDTSISHTFEHNIKNKETSERSETINSSCQEKNSRTGSCSAMH